ncbi:MAG: HupE/UreJ family protein [Deltaproteobacteria bacterium]
MMNRSKWALALFFVMSQSLLAHPLDMGLIVLSELDGGLKVRFEMNPNLIAQIPEKNPANLFEKFLQKFEISSDVGRCDWLEDPEIESTGPQSLGIQRECHWAQKPNRLVVHAKLWDEVPSSFHLLARYESSGREKLLTIDRDHPKIEWEIDKTHTSLWSFVRLGLDHIGVTPQQWWTGTQLRLPEGIDHILFVIALIFSGGGWIEILKMITGFTVGHSMTLTFASLGWVNVTSQWIEPIIALSIAWVAAQSLFQKKNKTHWKIACFFGFVHGLAFASAFTKNPPFK